MIIITAKKRPSKLESTMKLISDMKKELLVDPIFVEICKEYNFNTDIIYGIPIEFEEDIGASAKTVDSAIILNTSLLKEERNIIMRYIIHELVHSLQHMKGVGLEIHEAEEYLDRSDELEAFQFQIKYDSENRGKDHAIDYVKDLVEYHEIPEHKLEEKKEELLDKVS